MAWLDVTAGGVIEDSAAAESGGGIDDGTRGFVAIGTPDSTNSSSRFFTAAFMTAL